MTATSVEPGQVWVDNDPRVHLHGKRFVEVISVDGTHATVRGYRTHIAANRKIKKVYSKTTRIRLDRFKPTSTGYKRIS